ncbi:NAD(P)/FAD-dependent oxidoreductase [Pukyongiella litopenaei]|uniref:FAD-binding oxidoreductase n=1 Tax=Pukyongiella litopenaei TaxID=2605946 RepID=A0A2S0MQY2_9RHOB|nr:FAD-dependent oxidoreductase [Pukyongiella litopenaei]AVO38161.1 FAD-binding oxidoreductase [Pukyongiella litopenaei]
MNTADVLIIGGGAAGLTLAAELAGSARVVVLEAERNLGVHASGRSAAVFVPSYGHGRLRDVSALSLPMLKDPEPEWFPEPLLTPRGILRLVLPGGGPSHDAMTAGQPDIERLAPGEAARLFPLIRVDRLEAASYEPGACDIDADALMQGAARKARALGARICTGAQVTDIRRTGSTWRVGTATDRYEAPTLVNAAGAWANHVATLAGVPALPIQPCRRSVAALPLPPGLGRTPFTVTAPLRWYAKTEAGRLLVSPADEDPVEPHDAHADDMVVAEGLDRFSNDTGFHVTRVETTWAGLRMMTPDGYPVTGFDPRADGFFWLAGQAGFGIQCAPGLAHLAAALLECRHNSLADAFTPDRFLAG